MKWTHDKPTVVGWYWMRTDNNKWPPHIVHISMPLRADLLTIDGAQGYTACAVKDAHPAFEYYGPLAPPPDNEVPR